jgi:flagellar protein FliO/FliZ
MESEYIQVIITLGGVLSLMVMFVFLLKKIKFKKLVNDQHINILHTMPIGSKEKIILIEVNDAMLLLGATASSIQTLHIFDQKKILGMEDDVENKIGSFKEVANTLNGFK